MTQFEPFLSQKIDEKINTVREQLEMLPGVVIIHDLKTSGVVYMSGSGLKILNTTLDELVAMNTDYYTRFFNKEDAAHYVPKILGMLERNNDEETISFFHQIRRDEHSEWKWYVCGIRIFMRDGNGLPILTITVATPIDSDSYYITKIERMLEEGITANSMLHLFNSLTSREVQILKFMAMDATSKNIATVLSIAEDTVKTHRRNIKKKLQLNTQYELLRFAQSFNLV